MNRLDGKTALISGASRGIGEAAARLMISVGANVIIGDILKTKGEETAERLGPNAKFIHLDVQCCRSGCRPIWRSRYFG